MEEVTDKEIVVDDEVNNEPSPHTSKPTPNRYNLRQCRAPTFGSYTKPQKLNISQMLANKLSFDDIRKGYNPTTDDLQTIAYNFLNQQLH